jgi:rubrerythrin
MKVRLVKDSAVISDFDELEVLKISLKIETDGEKFYRSAVERSTDERMKRTFTRLAEDEQNHYRTFMGIYEAELRSRNLKPDDVDREEDIFTYMESGIFSKDPIAHSVKEAVMDGEIVELKSIVFYKEMLSQTKSESAKKALTEILEQENMHLNILKSWEAAIK